MDVVRKRVARLRGLDEPAQVGHFLLQSSDNVTEGGDEALRAPDVPVTQAVVRELLVEALESPVQVIEAPVDGVLLVLKSPVDVIEAPVGVALLVLESPVDGVETPLLRPQVGGR